MSFFKKTEAHLGVDIGAGGIKLVELHKTKGRPQLWTYGIAEEPLDIHIEHHEKTLDDLLSEKKERESIGVSTVIKPKKAIIQLDDPRVDRYAKLLKDLAKSSRVTTNRATASLPVSYIFHSVLTMPFVEEKKRDAIVRAEIAKVMPRPIEEMQVVYQEIPALAETDSKSKYIKLLVTAAPKDLVAFYTAIFQKAGFKKGDRVIVREEEGELRIKRAVDLVKELAGSIKVPEHLSGVDTDEAIRIAKARHFGKRE